MFTKLFGKGNVSGSHVDLPTNSKLCWLMTEDFNSFLSLSRRLLG
jgi:hypothetical protein